jgi:hypothetical protein
MLAYNDVLNELQDYILNDESIKKSLRMKMANPIKTDKQIIKKSDFKNDAKNNTLFIPNQQDGLFWCFYIMKNGDIKYEILRNKNALIAK